MLREEYEKPRKPPRLPQKPTEPTTFSWTVADATEADLPDVLALYRHYVRNSVVTFDEKPPTLTQFRSKFRHLQKLGYPFRIARSPRERCWVMPMSSPFGKNLLFVKRWKVLFTWAPPQPAVA